MLVCACLDRGQGALASLGELRAPKSGPKGGTEGAVADGRCRASRLSLVAFGLVGFLRRAPFSRHVALGDRVLVVGRRHIPDI